MEGNDLAALTLPHSLTSLDLGYRCDASLDHVVWPPHLARLIAGLAFKQPLLNWTPPASLTDLCLCSESGYGEWNRPVADLRLPSNLRKLTFGSSFNQPLTGLHFPSSLRVLTFSANGKFNQSLARHAWEPPIHLEELTLGMDWNRPCTEMHLPSALRKLTLSYRFNQPIASDDGKCSFMLPDTLVELRFGLEFKQSLRSLQLPPSIRLLSHPDPTPRSACDLPSHLPPRLRLLEVWNESVFHSTWANHPTWPKQCAVKYRDG